MSSLTSEEHADNHTWTVEMIRLSNPKVFVPKAFWMPVEGTSKWWEQVPKSFVLFGPGYLMSQKMPCSRYFWKNVLIGIRWGYGISWGLSNTGVSYRTWFMVKTTRWFLQRYASSPTVRPWFKIILWGFSNPRPPEKRGACATRLCRLHSHYKYINSFVIPIYLLMFGRFLRPTFSLLKRLCHSTPRLATRLPCHSRCLVQRRLGLMQIWKMGGAVETVDTVVVICSDSVGFWDDTVVVICDHLSWFCDYLWFWDDFYDERNPASGG